MPKNNGFAYVYNSTHIVKLLEKVQSTGKPDKLTITHVQKSWLLKDAKYSAVIELLREMGFLGKNGIPTSLYSEYQNPSKARTTLTKGIANAYPDLLKTYPKLHELPHDQLKGYVKEHTGADESVVKKIYTTISTLVSISSLSGSTDGEKQKEPDDSGGLSTVRPPVVVSPNVQLNIELHISPEMADDKIESIFRNMKKYLLTKDE